jgi:hypothetical protein
MEIAFDSWRFKSEGLHKLIVERGIRHPGYRDLDRSVAAAVAKPSAGGRGWRLDKSHHSRTIDSLIALAMAASRARARTRPVELLGFI